MDMILPSSPGANDDGESQIGHHLRLAQERVKSDLDGQYAAREERLTSVVNVLGFDTLDDLEDFIFNHGSVKVVPRNDSSTSTDPETQLFTTGPPSPNRLKTRYEERKKALLEAQNELSRVKVELGLVRSLLAQSNESLWERKQDVERLLQDTAAMREQIKVLAGEGRERDDSVELREEVVGLVATLEKAYKEVSRLEKLLEENGIEDVRGETEEEDDGANEDEEVEAKETDELSVEESTESVVAINPPLSTLPALTSYKTPLFPVVLSPVAAPARLPPAPSTSQPGAAAPSPTTSRPSQPQARHPLTSRSNPISSTSAPPPPSQAAPSKSQELAQRTSRQFEQYPALREQYLINRRTILECRQWSDDACAWFKKKRAQLGEDVLPPWQTLPALAAFKPEEYPDVDVTEGERMDYLDLKAREEKLKDFVIDIGEWKKKAKRHVEKSKEIVKKKEAEMGMESSPASGGRARSSRIESTQRKSKKEKDATATQRKSPRKSSRTTIATSTATTIPTPLTPNRAIIKTTDPKSAFTFSPAELGPSPKKSVTVDTPGTRLAPLRLETSEVTLEEAVEDEEPETLSDRLSQGQENVNPTSTIAQRTRSRSKSASPRKPPPTSRPTLDSPPGFSQLVARAQNQSQSQSQYPQTQYPAEDDLCSPVPPSTQPLRALPSPPPQASSSSTRKPASVLALETPETSPQKQNRKPKSDSPQSSNTVDGPLPPSPRRHNTPRRSRVKATPEPSPSSDDPFMTELRAFDTRLGLSPPLPAADWKKINEDSEKKQKKKKKDTIELEGTSAVESSSKKKKSKKRKRVEEKEDDGEEVAEVPKKVKAKKSKRAALEEASSEAEMEEDAMTDRKKGKKRRMEEEVPLEEQDSDLDRPPSSGEAGQLRWKKRIKLHRLKKAQSRVQEKVSDRREIEINPARNNGEKHHYAQVVRNKEARKTMYATACDECTEYYKRDVGGDPSKHFCGHRVDAKKGGKSNPFQADSHKKLEAHLADTSRHRFQHKPEEDPPGYWHMGFPTTQQVEGINRKSKAQKEERRLYQESEAERGGFYRYKE